MAIKEELICLMQQSLAQAEGLAFRNNTYGYISNERISSFITVTQKLRSFNILDFVPLYVLPISLKNFTVITVNGTNKITWSFDDIVQSLQVECSHNGRDFKILKTYDNSLKDIFFNKGLYAVNYYRLSWRKNSGPIQYSDIVRVKNDLQSLISSFSLKANGELSFLLSANAVGKYSFRLFSSDGKVLARIKEQVYAPGRNRIFISKKSILNNFVYVKVTGNGQETTAFLRIEK